ncbi:hypothetical protein [Sandarakinorhabdus sp.]|uniref:hypothetical protein n=1 Tax=Sandarakinorhabdus sp. TaxID=1916663 RepID=UPI00333E908B
MIRILGLALAIAGLGTPAMAATLIGKTASVAYFLPDTSTVYPQAVPDPGSFTIGSGIESTVNVEGVTFLDVDFGAKSLTVLFNTVLTNPTWNSAPFNGLRFSGNAISQINSVSVDPSTTLPGFSNARVTNSGGVLGLDWNGITYADGQKVTLNFGTVPEPMVWVQLLAGFALIGVVARGKPKASTALA